MKPQGRLAAPLIAWRLCAPHTSHTWAARPCMKMPKIASETDCNSIEFYLKTMAIAMELTIIIQTAISLLSLSVFEVISLFSYQISAVKKHEKLILFVDLDAEFNILKLLFEVFLPKIIRGAGNWESVILRVKFLCLKFGGTHCTYICTFIPNHFFLKLLKNGYSILSTKNLIPGELHTNTRYVV